ncbi:MAG TPA: tetratricopeptide repeat protein [Tenuifilaceae bacterium]|nr:tetratricopeptide repeat protein [Tenuifilaceae bacterium]HQB78224.1 tetratricopeptide repeat protein [Tenuifilaceae bacterium]
MKPLRFIVLFMLIGLACAGQNRKEIEELYKDANSYFYFEDYEEALALYLQVLKHNPDNYNLQYRIGFCYLNIPGQKQEAIPYLEQAANNTTARYNEVSTTEKQAPLDAIFYLGNAYFINNQLDKAERTYQRFKDQIKKEKRWDMSYYEHQTTTLAASRGIQKLPTNFIRTNLGETINDRFSNFNPVISGDGKTMAFTTKRKFYQAVYISRKKGEQWGTPQNITLDLFVDGNCSTLSLSHDGKELYLFRDDTHNGNIYVSRFNGEKWSPMKILNTNVNTEYYETHASISADGKSLYFTSNRLGGFGDLDIYVSRRDTGDNWGPAKNLGSTINTPLNENTPFVTTDGQLLYFSSEAHYNMGGYDYFVSQKTGEGWSKPINLGYPLNTTDDDLFFVPIKDGSYGLVALFDNYGFGEMDICEVEIFSPRYRKTILTSEELAARSQTDRGFKTLIIDTLKDAGLAILNPDKGENLTYIATDKKSTLFYQGSVYEMRDQSDAAKLLLAKLQRSNKKSIDLTQPNTKTSLVNTDSLLMAERKQLEENSKLLASSANPNLPAPIEEPLLAQPANNTAPETATNTDINTNETGIGPKGVVTSELYPSILLLGIQSKSLKNEVKLAFLNSWPTSSIEYNKALAMLIQKAIAQGEAEELLLSFVKLADWLVNNTNLQSIKQKRTIESNSAKDNFLYLLNKILEKASPELRAFIELALADNPNTQSFQELITLLRNADPELFNKFIAELITLFGEVTQNEFSLLPTNEQQRIEQLAKESAEGSNILSNKGLVGFALLLIVLAIAITVRYLVSKRKRSN